MCKAGFDLILEFHHHAITLSGETGTKLKCEILGGYYPLWWSITSGGDSREHRLPTAIVEMNSGTALDFVEDTGETIFGSSGHALNLKLNGANDTSKLKVILVEENDECFAHLKSVLTEQWPSLDLQRALGPLQSNNTGVYCLQKSAGNALDVIEQIPLGNSLFFFDPLLFTPWEELERVASRRIKSYYMTRTEFIVFLFTTDWLVGRMKMRLHPLPNSNDEIAWDDQQRETVRKMDELFGNKLWRGEILKSETLDIRIEKLVQCYRKRLHKWFRYVLPLPFNPKGDQIYHLFLCSNYEAGVQITRRFYEKFTNNPPYSPDSNSMYESFKHHHRQLVSQVSGRERPMVWKFLRAIIKEHDEGLCDIRCQDFRDLADDWQERLRCLRSLQIFGYLKETDRLTDAWEDVPPLYKLDWDLVAQMLRVRPPHPFAPLHPNSNRIPEQRDAPPLYFPNNFSIDTNEY